MTSPISVSCPTCGRPVPWIEASRWRPFCSKRCRLIDLGEWLNEERRIPVPGSDDESTTSWPETDTDDDRR